ncbi:MAG TPA: peptidoglycan DD-metalloendopeptidase family protein [Candidatus Latescibacteria bacterium]|nr:peptidoglycan DD-metalloendopeptidase family protein [Candidatus Latescibacterota bacterium]HOS64075.1 peptidoglycan DD-metalloendopeptidase family protein [Candidatus Latescibacterota bacterium]HPK76063.1 peptidoglycan DD-metalloendopeptidase family protein [Candidatus Latescibacterota bacterium]
MRLRHITTLVLCACTVVLAAGATEELPLLPPLRIPPVLTSAFCEYRPLRFHAGIDYSTGRRKGLPIQAIADGYVWRVRVSPFGYGKVLYFRLNDGRVAVFAHLSRFTPRVEELLLKKQIENEQFVADVFFEPGEAPAKRGEVIAYSGDTGAGPPHLHFELRNERNVALNPLLQGYAFSDNIPPRVFAVAFIPLDGRARIDGKPESANAKLVYRNGMWTIPRVPRLSGRIGVTIAAADQVQRTGNIVGIFGTTLAVDGQEVFRREYDNLEMDNQFHAPFDRSFIVNRVTKGRYYNLFKLPGNRLRFYGDAPAGAGILQCGTGSTQSPGTSLARGLHEATITVSDASGNATRVRFSFRVDRNPEFVAFALRDSAGVKIFSATAEDSGDVLRVFPSGGEAGSRAIQGRDRVEWTTPVRNPAAPIRVVVTDSAGNRSVQSISPNDFATVPRLHEEHSWGRDWLLVSLTASRPLKCIPSAVALRAPVAATKLEPAALSAALSRPEVLPDPEWPSPDFRGRWENSTDGTYAITERAANDTLPVFCELVANLTYRLTLPLTSLGGDVDTVRILADGAEINIPVQGRLFTPMGGVYSHAGGACSVMCPPGALGEPVFVRVQETTLHGPPEPELRQVGNAFRVEPQEQPLADEVHVQIRIPEGEDTSGVALYGTTNGVLRFLSAEKDSTGRYVRGRTRLFSTVCLFRDTAPPRLVVLSPSPNGTIRNGLVTVSGHVEDRGSGLDPGRDPSEVRLDGKWVPAVPDASGHFAYRSTTPLPSGRHTVSIKARDLAGNVREVSFEFRVP